MTTGRIPFPVLLWVETRKLADTRSGKVITGVLAALAAGAVVARGIASGPGFYSAAVTAGIVVGILLPVLAVLTVTGEWSHRTALTTFTLEPRRGRVWAAKCLPPLIASVLACAFAMLVAVPVTAAVAAAQGVPADWRVALPALAGWTAATVLLTAQGLALGTVLMNAPAAIVVFLSNAVLWSVVARLGPAGEAATRWLDLNTATIPLVNGTMTGADAARVAVSSLAWIVVPMAAGMVRTMRREVA
ncbi:ABC transporter permease [Nonomuraea mesophila]|uniref:ABC transporter permease n=1 Tax=Nonomuraea mesophila TaxID=2530382 RepID=A0A4R5EV99_9ACTN|nr:ABC transporter permease subunit [Nonomuraea mesophila]TDE38801.1 ABC transporter permease [Nonomuraea mesophila]